MLSKHDRIALMAASCLGGRRAPADAIRDARLIDLLVAEKLAEEPAPKGLNPKTVQIPGLGLEVDATPVTVGLWRSVMGGVPPEVAEAGHRADYPITYVSWHDVQEFCRRRGNGWRLLTEEEWEACCRAGSEGERCGSLDQIAVYGRKRLDTPVATKQPNAWGLYDTIGLVWEWTSTADGPHRVIRGGSWGYDSADYLSASYRNYYTPGYRLDNLGFRCSRPLAPKVPDPKPVSPEVAAVLTKLNSVVKGSADQPTVAIAAVIEMLEGVTGFIRGNDDD